MNITHFMNTTVHVFCNRLRSRQWAYTGDISTTTHSALECGTESDGVTCSHKSILTQALGLDSRYRTVTEA